MNVDTTVQEKAITFPTDAKLYHKMRQVLVKETSKGNIQLRQSYKNLPTSFFGKKTGRAEPCSLIFL
ncbi:hypothetical protein LEP1GSC035_2980 [Leptospira noguchii str. 2007001578]|uniref:Uncharacterized protein n=1 Tax=Leptospira noguchii str. 2007001578 TaxID=1049974 RepID=A0ABP2T4L9_9LEPT|nr:hypothetical protein [Leptospira noguchii]EMM99225.1 hypothetical protein LEP1GSC035_2980 [Leptospira noguchii str. 2007001578]